MSYAGLSNGDLGLSISNDMQAKRIRAVWTAYDEAGGMVDVVERVVELGANEYKRLSIPAGWNLESYTSTVFLWDADTLVPLAPKQDVALR